MIQAKALIIGATGTVGSQVVRELDQHNEGIDIRLATSRTEVAEKWRDEGREAVELDLNRPETFAEALAGVSRVFLLTGYTSDMLFQSKKLIDAAVDAGVSHIVHLGVFTSGRDRMPHFTWHDLIETYIKASGLAWTHLHPNVITDTTLKTNPPIKERGYFSTFTQDLPQGWVCAADIAAVAAAVLREGPEKHGGADYWLSTEVLTGREVADILSSTLGTEIRCEVTDAAMFEAQIAQIRDAGQRAYMESALITMKLTAQGQMTAQTTAVRDDVLTVLGRPGTTMAEWARQNLS